jgi:hypothetical protein
VEQQTLLAQLAADRHWTPTDAVREFSLVAQQMRERVTVSPRQWQRWCAGEIGGLPRAGACRVLERMFGRIARELFEPPNPAAKALTAGIPWRVQVSPEEAASWAAGFTAWAETTNVGPMTVQRFEAETRRLARDYLLQAPVPIFTQTANLARTVFDLIQGGHQYLAQTRDLYLAAGRLAALLSWISGDLGQAAAAAEHARAAWICADQADHPTLRAWAMSVASRVAFWDGDYVCAAECARVGQQYRAAGTALVMLACQEADALKTMRRVKEAEDAVARAQTFGEQVNTVDDIGGLFSCGRARQANYEIGVHLAAVRPRQALAAAAAAESAFATGDQWAYGTWAQIRFGRALAHIMAGSLDGASESLSPVLAMSRDRRLDTLVRRAGDVARVLSLPKLGRSPGARELVGRIQDYRSSRVAVREVTPIGAAGDDLSRTDARPLVVAAGMADRPEDVHLAHHL